MKKVSLFFKGILLVFSLLLVMGCSSTKRQGQSKDITYIEANSIFYMYRAPLNNYNVEQINSCAFIENLIDQSHLDLTARPVKFRNIAKVVSAMSRQKEGSVLFVDFCVDSNGEVIAARLQNDSTIQFKSIVQKKNLMKAILGYRFEPSSNPGIECVSMKIKLAEINTNN